MILPVTAGQLPEIKLNTQLIKDLRKLKNFSVSDIAYLLGYKTPTGYWLVEKGRRQVGADVLYRISQVYERPMEDFLIVEDTNKAK